MMRRVKGGNGKEMGKVEEEVEHSGNHLPYLHVSGKGEENTRRKKKMKEKGKRRQREVERMGRKSRGNHFNTFTLRQGMENMMRERNRDIKGKKGMRMKPGETQVMKGRNGVRHSQPASVNVLNVLCLRGELSDGVLLSSHLSTHTPVYLDALGIWVT